MMTHYWLWRILLIGNGDEITDGWFMLGVRKKTNELIKPRKLENKQPKKPKPEKKLITPIRIFLKKFGLVFQFHKLE
jgi:hypothetical protein